MMATQSMMGSIKTPVLAATSSTAAIAATGGSTYRAPASASTGFINPSVNSVSTKGAAVAAAASRGSKEVDLNAIAKQSGVEAPPGLYNAPTGDSSSGVAAAGGGAGIGPTSGLGSNSGMTKAVASRSNSRQSVSPDSSFSASPEELTTYFIRAPDYKAARDRLPKMQKALEEAGVSVTNLKKENFGALPKEADTHILDNGSAFVLKKKK